MTDNRAGAQVVARIGFAERWLDRARRQVADGNLTRGVLTLVLAEAEVHHAVEVAGVRPGRTARRPAVTSFALALTLAAGVTVALTQFTGTPPLPAAGAAPPIVTLGQRMGAMLDLVEALPPAAVAGPTAGPAIPPRSVASPSRRAAPAVRATPVLSPAAAGPPPAAPAVIPPAPQSAAPAPVMIQPPPPTVYELSAGDLIDLVLTAERTLRTGQVRR